jgi:hypothetical protein
MTPQTAWRLINRERDVDVAIDRLFDYVDDLLLKEEFDEVNSFLQLTNVPELSSDMAVAVLSITLAAKDKLPAREGLYYRIRKELQSYFDSDKTERLLKDLY